MHASNSKYLVANFIDKSNLYFPPVECLSMERYSRLPLQLIQKMIVHVDSILKESHPITSNFHCSEQSPALQRDACRALMWEGNRHISYMLLIESQNRREKW